VSALAAVLRVRTLLERRALAEHAAAERAVVVARGEVAVAREARAGHRPQVGSTDPRALLASRVGGLALDEQVARAGERQLATGREAEVTGQRRVAAAVARRSVERLDERRHAAAAVAAAKRTERQLDDLALDRWRRS
jgi:hypothetical protein